MRSFCAKTRLKNTLNRLILVVDDYGVVIFAFELGIFCVHDVTVIGWLEMKS